MSPLLTCLVEQRLGLFQVGRIEPLLEPAIDGCEECTGLVAPALIAPEASKACRGSQLPRRRTLRPGYVQRLSQALFGLSFMTVGAQSKQLPFEPVLLGHEPVLPGPLRPAQRLGH